MAKRHSIDDKRQKKRSQLIERVSVIFECSSEDAEKLLSQSLIQAVRINPLKGDRDEILKVMQNIGWRGTKIDWCDNTYSIEKGYEELRDSSLVTEGKIYIQNRSSWLPVIALDPQPEESVLDVCAAPGGKSSHIAAIRNNKGRLVVNDNSRARLSKLKNNLERLGVTVEYHLLDATRLDRSLGSEQFDKILLDAPCSGEGLINLSNLSTLDTWSVAHIRRLASLQKQLIRQAWKALKPGGRLVYSTCTMAPEENEAVIDWLLCRNSDAHIVKPLYKPATAIAPILSWNSSKYDQTIDQVLRIPPSGGNEAFFVCVLEKAT